MIRVELTQPIAASISNVWAQIVDLESHSEWMSDAERITYRTEQRTGVGTSIDCATKVGPLRTVDVMTVTEWIDKKRMAVEHHGLVSGAGAFELHPDGDHTRMVWVENLKLPWMFGSAIGEVFAKPILIRIWRHDLAALAALCERR